MCVCQYLDRKTVRIFAYSSTREQSNKRSGISLLMLREKPTVLQSSQYLMLEVERTALVRKSGERERTERWSRVLPGSPRLAKIWLDRLACN